MKVTGDTINAGIRVSAQGIGAVANVTGISAVAHELHLDDLLHTHRVATHTAFRTDFRGWALRWGVERREYRAGVITSRDDATGEYMVQMLDGARGDPLVQLSRADIEPCPHPEDAQITGVKTGEAAATNCTMFAVPVLRQRRKRDWAVQ